MSDASGRRRRADDQDSSSSDELDAAVARDRKLRALLENVDGDLARMQIDNPSWAQPGEIRKKIAAILQYMGDG